jgi:hypothetical protein
MSTLFPTSLPSPTTVGPFGQRFVCLTGVVNLFQFFAPPQPGSVIGELNTLFGFAIPLVQSRPTPAGTTTLSSVDRQFATLCGNLVLSGNRLALDVRAVIPRFGFTTPGFPFS